MTIYKEGIHQYVYKSDSFQTVATLSYTFSLNISNEDQVTEAQCRMKIVQVWKKWPEEVWSVATVLSLVRTARGEAVTEK